MTIFKPATPLAQSLGYYCNMHVLQGHVLRILLVFAFSGVFLAMVELLGVISARQQAKKTLRSSTMARITLEKVNTNSNVTKRNYFSLITWLVLL